MYGYTSNRQQPRTTSDQFDTWHELRMSFEARRRELSESIDVSISSMVNDPSHEDAHHTATVNLKFWSDIVIANYKAEEYLRQFAIDK